MTALSGTARGYFKKWGRRGGERRRELLSPARRRQIAVLAAHSRWEKERVPETPSSFRLENPNWDDPVWLEEILVEGRLSEWRQLYRRISDHPFGEAAKALEKVVKGVEIYGSTPLWRGILKSLQGGIP